MTCRAPVSAGSPGGDSDLRDWLSENTTKPTIVENLAIARLSGVLARARMTQRPTRARVSMQAAILFAETGELFGLVFVHQRVDYLAEIALHDFFELV